jgi:hypothetical protein
MVQDGTIQSADFPDGNLVGILTFDGRQIGGRQQVFVGLKFPFIEDFGRQQSSDVVFPIAIFDGKDDVKNMEAFFNARPQKGGQTLSEQILEMRTRAPIPVFFEEHPSIKEVKVVQHMVADQKSMWAALGCCQGPKTNTPAGLRTQICSFCSCLNHPDDKGDFDRVHNPRVWEIFDPATEMTFCLLHMKLRICEKLFNLAATASYRTHSKKKLQAAVRGLGIHMTIERKKGKLQVTSMNGRDCEKLMAGFGTWVPAVGIEGDEAGTWLTLWRSWTEYFEALNYRYGPDLGPSNHAVEQANQLRVTFGEAFLDLFDKSDVTPYIHLAMEHAVNHLVRFKALWLYSNEGFEAANKRHRFWYGRCTQRGGVCGAKNQHKKSHKRKGRRACPKKQLLFKALRVLHYKLKTLQKTRLDEQEEDVEEESDGVEPEKKESEASEKASDAPSNEEESDEDEDEDGVDILSDLTRSLSASDRAALTESCRQPCTQEAGIHRFEREELVLTPANLQALLVKDKWLHSATVNAALRDLNRAQSKVLALPTEWSEKLLTCQADPEAFGNLSKWRASKLAMSKVLPETEGDQACTHLVVPIHRPGHWVAAVLDIQAKRWTHLDSWQRGGTEAQAKMELDHLQAFVNHEAHGGSIPWAAHELLPSLGQQYETDDAHLPMSRRGPGGDCGVFMVANAFAIACGKESVEGKQMVDIRCQLAHRLLARRGNLPRRLDQEDDSTDL